MMKYLFILFFLSMASNLKAETTLCFEVDGMTCGKCVTKIQNHFEEHGIKSTEVSLIKGSIKFHLNPTQNLKDDFFIKELEALNYKVKKTLCE